MCTQGKIIWFLVLNCIDKWQAFIYYLILILDFYMLIRLVQYPAALDSNIL